MSAQQIVELIHELESMSLIIQTDSDDVLAEAITYELEEVEG